MWRTIERDEVPDILYHYCCVDTFMKIIENKTIRLSNIFKMNDSSEVKHVLEYLSSDMLIKKYRKTPFEFKHGELKNEFAFDKVIYEIKRKVENFISYIACFSKTDDDLGQWRAYGDDGKGVMIGFDGKKLFDFAQSNHSSFKLVDVSYSVEDCKRFIEINVVDEILKALKSAVKNGPYTYEMMVIINIIDYLEAVLLTAVQFKHEAFIGEHEWRLCLVDTQINKTYSEWCLKHKDDKVYDNFLLKGMAFKYNGERIISYFDLCFTPDLIKCLTIGPRSKILKDDIDFEMLLKINGFNNGSIEKSNIPYTG